MISDSLIIILLQRPPRTARTFYLFPTSQILSRVWYTLTSSTDWSIVFQPLGYSQIPRASLAASELGAVIAPRNIVRDSPFSFGIKTCVCVLRTFVHHRSAPPCVATVSPDHSETVDHERSTPYGDKMTSAPEQGSQRVGFYTVSSVTWNRVRASTISRLLRSFCLLLCYC